MEKPDWVSISLEQKILKTIILWLTRENFWKMVKNCMYSLWGSEGAHPLKGIHCLEELTSKLLKLSC